MGPFKFDLGEGVKINGNETGKVTGRAEYMHSEPSYYVLYVAGDGRSIQAWWGESALESLPVEG